MARKKWFAALGAFICCAAAVGLHYGLRRAFPGWPRSEPYSTDFPAGRSRDQTLEQAGDPKEGPNDIKVQRVLYYTVCGHAVTRHEPPIENGDRIDLDALRRANPGCEVQAFPSHVRITHTIRQYCPSHYVLFPDGEERLSIYRNITGGERLSLWITFEVDPSAIPWAVRESLVLGMPFDTVEDIEHFLEDVSS